MAITPADQRSAAGGDKRSLLEIAIDVHQDLGALATGLAHAGADPKAVAGLQRIVTMIGDLAKALGQGPSGAQAAQPGAGEPPAPEPAAAPPPAAAPQGEPPQGTLPGERPNGLHEATQHLQAALALSRQRAAAGGSGR